MESFLLSLRTRFSKLSLFPNLMSTHKLLSREENIYSLLSLEKFLCDKFIFFQLSHLIYSLKFSYETIFLWFYLMIQN